MQETNKSFTCLRYKRVPNRISIIDILMFADEMMPRRQKSKFKRSTIHRERESFETPWTVLRYFRVKTRRNRTGRWTRIDPRIGIRLDRVCSIERPIFPSRVLRYSFERFHDTLYSEIITLYGTVDGELRVFCPIMSS